LEGWRTFSIDAVAVPDQDRAALRERRLEPDQIGEDRRAQVAWDIERRVVQVAAAEGRLQAGRVATVTEMDGVGLEPPEAHCAEAASGRPDRGRVPPPEVEAHPPG